MRFSDQHRRWRATERHRLAPATRTDDVVQITKDLVALHSSDPATVYLSVAARMANPTIDAIEHALYEQRSVVRHHGMRRTLWVLTPAFARLAHGAATAKIARAERKRTEAALADTGDIADAATWLDDALAEIITLLGAQGPLSTRAIGKALPHLVRPVIFGAKTKHPAAINAHTKVLQGAGFDAALVRGRPAGGWNSAEYEWNTTKSWLGVPINDLDEQRAASPFLHEWLLRFGPATMTDIRWWFGWTATLAKRALGECEATPVQLDDGGEAFVACGDTALPSDPGPWVQLLPGLDPTVMGWKERRWYLDPAMQPRLFDRFGNAGPTIAVDGRVVGGWVQRPTGQIVTELAVELSASHESLLEEAIARQQAVVGEVVVRPRFPAPAQRDLYRD